LAKTPLIYCASHFNFAGLGDLFGGNPLRSDGTDPSTRAIDPPLNSSNM